MALRIPGYVGHLAAFAVLAIALSTGGATAQFNEGAGSSGAVLERAEGALRARDFDRTIDLLTDMLSSPRLPAESAARGYFYRGIAFAETGKTASAMSDFTNALWLDALPRAEVARLLVYRSRLHLLNGDMDAGRSDIRAALRIAPQDSEAQTVARAAGIAPSTEETGAIGPKPERTVAETPHDPVGAGFSVQLAALSDMQRAEAAWRQISGAFPDLLEGLDAHFEEGGSLIRLRVGPFATRRQSEELCRRLRARSQECFISAP